MEQTSSKFLNLSENYPLKILVAEDNEMNQKLFLRIFKKMGYNADFASNGLEVLNKFKTNSYDIIFTDIQMPEMDGIEVTKRILSDETIAKKPVIVAMTGGVMPKERELCFEAGMNDFISKPIFLDDLKKVIIRNYLSLKK